LIACLKVHRDRHCADYYYQVRASVCGSPLERAARLIYLNKTCFNGLYRENSKGLFNVPIGSYKKPTICDDELLYATSAALRSTHIESGCFETVLHHATSSHDFVYLDPPYHPLSATSKFTSYNRYAFTEADQIRLRDTVVTLANRGVKVMLSNSDCPFIRELYQDFTTHTIVASRAINSNAEKRGKITEVLVTSY
jgi:DNA adenine methylase